MQVKRYSSKHIATDSKSSILRLSASTTTVSADYQYLRIQTRREMLGESMRGSSGKTLTLPTNLTNVALIGLKRKILKKQWMWWPPILPRVRAALTKRSAK